MCLRAARPLADMLWTRESEAGSFTTPERRAALEARLAEVTGTIADETVRRYYRQDFAARLRGLFAPAEASTRRRTGRPPGNGALAKAVLGRTEAAAPAARPATAARRLRPRRRLWRGEPAPPRQSAASRPSHRDSAPRGADPAGGAQPSVASARSPRGIGRNRVPPRRYQEAQGRADRRPRPSVRSRRRQKPATTPARGRGRPGGAVSGTDPARALPICSAASSAPSPRRRSGARGRRPRRAMFC